MIHPLVDEWLTLSYEHSNDPDIFIWKKHENVDYPPRFHSYVEIYFVFEGEMKAEINGNKYSLSAGDILIVNPLNIHKYIKTGYAYVGVLIFDTKYLDNLYHEFGNKTLPTFLNDKEYNADIFRILDEVSPSYSNNQTLSHFSKKAHIDFILDKIVSRYGFTGESSFSNKILEIINYIFEHSEEKISLELLASKFNYSKSSISRILSTYLKTDLRSFVNDIRVERVKTYLSNPDYSQISILSIATMCGFDSPATFYRAYKRRYGTTPKR